MCVFLSLLVPGRENRICKGFKNTQVCSEVTEPVWWSTGGKGEKDEKGRASQVMSRHLDSSQDVTRKP